MVQFTPDISVLDYGVLPHVAYREIRDRFYLAWPTWSYRVVVPTGETSELDILERAVLRLRFAKVTVQRMAALLNVDEKLLAHVERELERSQLLHPHGLTKDGEAVLRGDLDRLTRAGRFQTGLIFQDPFSLEVWPYFAERTVNANVSFDPKPQVSRGNGRPRPLYYVEGQPPTPSAPSAQQIYRAYERTRKRQRNVSDQDDSAATRIAEQALSRARLVDPRPVPMYLLAEVYVPAEEDAWYVTSPYEGRVRFSPELKGAIERRSENDPQLARLLQRLTDSTVLPRSLDEQHAQFTAIAQQNLAPLLHALDHAYPSLRQALEECEAAAVEIRNFDYVPHLKLKSINVVMRNLLEATLEALSQRYPIPPSDELLSGVDAVADQNALTSALRTLGAAPLSARLSGVKLKALREWVDGVHAGRAWNDIRRHLLAHVLFAARRQQHPLRTGLRAEATILNEFDGLYELFNPAAHYNEERFTPEQVEERIQRLYRSIMLILNVQPELAI